MIGEHFLAVIVGEAWQSNKKNDIFSYEMATFATLFATESAASSLIYNDNNSYGWEC
jgi:hypothetical protein